MGGMGSGLYGSGAKRAKTATEHCRSIDIRRWQREGVLNRSSFAWTWHNDKGEETASISVFPHKDYVTLSYSANNEPVKTKIPYDETKTGFGVRKWFCCPACGDRVAVLYLKGKCFACRQCHNLNYRSSQLSGDMAYYHRQLEKLSKKLGAEYDPMSPYPPFPKPKNMHWKTYEKLAQRYMKLAEKRERTWLVGAKRILNR